MDMKGSVANEQEVYRRIRGLVSFAKSVLHLPFPDLELVNPSFTVLAKACDFLAALLRKEASDANEVSKKKGDASQINDSDVEQIAEYMRDIAEAIVDRDDAALVDSMAILDDFLCRTTPKGEGSNVVKL